MKNYYEILGISRSATPEEIKVAYRKLMKENHPDMKANDRKKEELSKDINEAYSVLGDKDKKAEYDKMFISTSSTTNSNINQNNNSQFNIFDTFVSPLTFDFNLYNRPFGKSLEEEYDEFITWLNEIDEECKEFGLTSTKIRESIKDKRGILTKEKINSMKNNISNQLENLKKISKLFDKFKEYYLEEKERLKNQGENLPQRFDDFIDPKNRIKFTKEEIEGARKELVEIIYEVSKKRNLKIQKLDLKLKEKGWSITDIMKRKSSGKNGILSSQDLTNEDLEETEKIIDLLNKITNNLKPLNIRLKDLLRQLNIKELPTLKELEIINRNVIENNNGLMAKWKISHMVIEELSNNESRKI